jgi:hypothetical protein
MIDKLLTHLTRCAVFVAESDQLYSPARIAGSVKEEKFRRLTGEEQFCADCCSPSASGRVADT